MALRVIAVDDHPIVVDGLMALVAREAPDVELIATATTWADLRNLVAGLPEPPDLALVDIHLADGTDNADIVAALTADGIRVVVLTSEVRPIPIRRAIRAGAKGLALKSDPTHRILSVIESVGAGDFAVSSDLAFVLVSDENLTAKLAPREIQVLSLLADGVPRKAIGARLDPPVTMATVVTYINRACDRYRALGRDVATPRDAIWAAIEDGYLDLPEQVRGL